MIFIRNPNARISNPYGFTAPAGEPIHVIFMGVWKTDRLELVEAGTVNLQDRIQVQAPATDLTYMIKRLKLGDNSVLSKKEPLYGDFTQLPSNGTELVNTLLRAEYEFNQLPLEDRKKHGYDYRSWLSSIFKPVVANPVGEKPVVEKPVVENPVVNNVKE